MVPTTAPVELVFVGETLDGRRIEIRPDADTVFVGDVPQVVQQTVDIAVEAGCDGVIAQRDLWASRVNDPVIGDEASVYAHHAQNVANYIGCDVAADSDRRARLSAWRSVGDHHQHDEHEHEEDRRRRSTAPSNRTPACGSSSRSASASGAPSVE